MSTVENDVIIEKHLDDTIDQLLEVVTNHYNWEVSELMSYGDYLDTVIYKLEAELAEIKGEYEERRDINAE